MRTQNRRKTPAAALGRLYKRRLLLRKKRPSGKTERRFCMLQVNYALNFSSFSRPSLLATQMLATASPTTFREVTSISMGRLMARMRE